MRITDEESILYMKAAESLLFDDLYDFVLFKWPEEIETSIREYVDYDKLHGTIKGLGELEESYQVYFESFSIGNLLMHLSYSLSIVIQKAGLMQDLVRLREINRGYVRYWFEEKSIGYAVETEVEKIPPGIRGNLDDIYDKELAEKYFQRNPRGTLIQ